MANKQEETRLESKAMDKEDQSAHFSSCGGGFFELPVFAILLIVLGVILLARELLQSRNE
jgi:hypothetical protein